MMKWYEEAIFYHMYPLGMVGAPFENKGQTDKKGMEELLLWIPYLKETGFTAIYIGPLFESMTHGYDTTDYTKIDRRLGTNEEFARFVEECHKAGIKVVVDGVFNHTGREFFAFRDIQNNKEQSVYKEWYRNIRFDQDSPYHDGFSYEAWRNCYELVNLNLYHPQVRDYLFGVIEGWIKEFSIDGIRLDCADVLEFGFMKEMRLKTAQWKEDFWLMGEVIHGDYSRWANHEVLHSVTDYELHKGLYSGHNDHNYFEIAHTVRRLFDERGGICKDAKLYSFVDNHDVDRIVEKLNNKENLYPVYTLLFTLPGIPSVYYGSEWGIEGKKNQNSDAPLRPAVGADSLSDRKNKLWEYISMLCNIHKKYKELTEGVYQELLLANRQYIFSRKLEHTAIVVLVNNDEKPATLRLPDFMQINQLLDCFEEKQIEKSENGNYVIELPANSGRILYCS